MTVGELGAILEKLHSDVEVVVEIETEFGPREIIPLDIKREVLGKIVLGAKLSWIRV